jgi:uncharacterized protein (DUF2336 family)
MAADLMKDLKAVDKELKALSKKVAQLITAVGKVKHPKVPKKSAPKKAAAKKPVKKVAAKKTAKKTAVVKKGAEKSASDTVLALINRSKKGLDNAALIKKTGYDKIKVRNIVFRLKNLNKIKTASRGVFVKA